MFGNGIVFIPALGMAVSGDSIISPISLRYEYRNRFLLNRDESTMFTNPELMVGRNIEVDSIATIVIVGEALLNSGENAATINSKIVQQALNDIVAQKALINKLDEEDEKPRRGRRGRKAKVEEDDEDEDESEEEEGLSEDEKNLDLAKSVVPYIAFDILVDRVVIEDSVSTEMRKSLPYRKISTIKKGKYAEALSNNLAKLRKSISARGDSLNQLQSGSFEGAEAIDDATQDMVPSLDKNLRSIDDAGLKNFEAKLRADVTAAEDRIRNLYTFFEEKVIGKVNEDVDVKGGLFTESEITVAGTTISRAEVLAKLFTEELQPIAFGTKTPVKK